MIIFISGMIRSGSTLHLNMVQDILTTANISFDASYVETFEDIKAVYEKKQDSTRVQILKFHFFDSRMSALLSDPDIHAFYVYRNSLDMAASLIRKTSSSFEEHLPGIKSAIETKYHFLAESNLNVSRYEDIFISGQLELAKIARVLKLEISPQKIVELADDLTLAAQKDRLQKMDYVKVEVPGDSLWTSNQDEEGTKFLLLNPERNLHHDHITSDGTPGRWIDTLEPEQASRVLMLESEAASKNISSLQAAHRKELSQAAGSRAKSEEQLKQLSTEVDAMRAKLESAYSENTEVRADLENARSENEAVCEENINLINAREALTKQLQTEELKIHALERDKVELNATLTELDQNYTQLETDFHEVTKKAQELELNVTSAARRILALKESTEIKSNVISKLLSSVEQKESLISKLHTENSRLKEENASSRAETEALRELFEKSAQRNAQRYDHLDGAGSKGLIHKFRRLLHSFTIRRHIRRIRNSEYFNGEWYLQKYPDLKASSVDPAAHYFKYGGREGRAASLDFCSQSYLLKYPDVRVSNLNPLLHYINRGKEEGRTAFPVREAAGDDPEEK
ncbi:sulfotransferase domain-containing protein [Parvularcula marina]|uniref:Sulfotransferase domain-containing protein n=1 Tax=Parvularcula marina TaxID=2292771 RepID=A0A371RHJ5_9PROT|nr:sulfotransferase domain-containing protein [Parvularcula marina]RFB04926.1 hypothetical protein DX908_06280 [Parvularcula marina]